MTCHSMQEAYRPYYEALKRIVQGQPVEGLDQILQRSEEHYRADFPQLQGQPSPVNVDLRFAAAAENRILHGEDPIKAYERPEATRDRQGYRSLLRRELAKAIPDLFMGM